MKNDIETMPEEMPKEGMSLMQDATDTPRGFGDTEMSDEDSEQPTEAEQMDFDLLTVRARKMIFGQGKDNILKMLGSGESPAKAIGQVGAIILKTLMLAAKQSGREISADAAVNAAAEIAGDLNELASLAL